MMKIRSYLSRLISAISKNLNIMLFVLYLINNYINKLIYLEKYVLYC